MSCDGSCDHGHVPLHHPRNKRKRGIKSKKIDKRKRKSKIKYKNSSIPWYIIDINHCINQVLPVFDILNKELSPDFWLVNTFSNCFSWNIMKCKDVKARTIHLNNLNNIYQDSSNSPDTIFIISDASVKNNIVTSISYI